MRYLPAALLLLVLPAAARDDALPTRPAGVSAETRRAIDRGLKFLAREQSPDGSWRNAGRFGSYPVAMTGLSGLAMMASGSTSVRGPYAKQVRRAVAFCLTQRQPNGLIAAVAEEAQPMYGHGFAMLFLAQAYGMEEDLARQGRIRAALVKGIELIARSQSREGGWYYTPDANTDEGSVTVTQVQALRACRNAGLHVPKKVIDGAIRYLERSQRSDGGIAYRVTWPTSRRALTAAACAVLYNAGKYDSPMAERCFEYAWRHCQPTTGGSHRCYTRLYMSQAVWQRGDRYWRTYFPALQRTLLRLQQGNGSWTSDFGLIYGTTTALIALQIPYNHLPILSR